jgi:Iodothyronine deiodinase
VGHLVELYNDYKDRADFLAVYIREAHPLDEWQMKPNLDQGVCYPQPHTLAQRVAIASDFTSRFKFPLPLGIDDMSDAANKAFAAWPERIYIIDEAGKIVYRGGLGPFNYHPEEARAWLASRFPASAIATNRP